MTELLIQLKGDEEDLNALCDIFRSLSFHVSKEKDGYHYLRSSHFTPTIDEEVREERAAELIRRLNVTARLLLGGNYFPVNFDGVARVEGSEDRIIRTVTSDLHTSWQVRTHYESASPEEAEFLIARLSGKELQRIVDLLAQSLVAAPSDDSKSFLFGWTALEIFINKFFSQYERAFVDAVTSETSVHGTSRYFERVTQVMKDKYRLVDKFGVVAAALAGETSDADIDRLKRIKKVRDELLHGQDAPVTSLVNTELRELLSTYLHAHLTRSCF
jgi:hypothetical protein